MPVVTKGCANTCALSSARTPSSSYVCTPYSARNEHVRQHMYTPAMPASLKVNG